MSAQVRFETRVVKGEKCWLWMGARDNKGYGVIMVNGKLTRSHRYAYEAGIGPIPKDLHVLHDCDNPPCVNPSHLRIGTNSDNVKDRVKRGRTHDHSGEKASNAKLSFYKAEQIRNLRARGAKVKDIAKEFGVGRNQIWRVVSGRLWVGSPSTQ